MGEFSIIASVGISVTNLSIEYKLTPNFSTPSLPPTSDYLGFYLRPLSPPPSFTSVYAFVSASFFSFVYESVCVYVSVCIGVCVCIHFFYPSLSQNTVVYTVYVLYILKYTRLVFLTYGIHCLINIIFHLRYYSCF